MGFHEIAVRLGLSYTSNKEAEFKLAKFIENKFILAAEEFEKYVNEKPHPKSFLDCLREVWKENDGEECFYVEDLFLKKYFPDLCGSEHTIQFLPKDRCDSGLAQTHHSGGKYWYMVIAIGILEKSENVKQLRHNLHKIIAIVYHECDHVYNESECALAKGIEKSILHHIDNAEIRANSKSLAYIYFKVFPNKRFNYKRLREYIEKNYNKTDQAHIIIRNLELMRDPTHFVAYKKDAQDYIKNRILTGGHIITVGKLRKAFIKCMNYVTYFVEYLNKHPFEKI